MDTKIENIIDALIKKSNDGEVVWSKMSNKEGFKLQLSDSTLCVLRNNNNARIVYYLRIYNADGNMIVNESVDAAIRPNKLVALYESANQAFYKKDSTLESILNQLNTTGKIGVDDNLPF